jgi:hypothetical protein
MARSGLNWLRELITFGLASSKSRQQTVGIIQPVIKGCLAPGLRHAKPEGQGVQRQFGARVNRMLAWVP